MEQENPIRPACVAEQLAILQGYFPQLSEKQTEQFLLYTFGSALILCVILMAFKKEKPGKVELLFGLLIGIPNFFSAKFLLKALRSVPAIITYPTYSIATIVVVSFVGVLFFKESVGRRQKIGMVIIFVALALLNI